MVPRRTFRTAVAIASYFFGTILSTDAQPVVSREYTVVNNCPTSINLYVGGVYDATLATGASTTTTGGVDAGFFYTTANGGDTTGDATRAGFYGSDEVSLCILARIETRVGASTKAPTII